MRCIRAMSLRLPEEQASALAPVARTDGMTISDAVRGNPSINTSKSPTSRSILPRASEGSPQRGPQILGTANEIATALTPHALSLRGPRTSFLEARHIMNPEQEFAFRA